MPGQIFDHIRELYVSELYDDLKQLVTIVLSLTESSVGLDAPEVLSLPQKYQTLIYYGDALYHLREYKKAESILLRCQLLRKTLTKNKIKSVGSTELTSEVDLKYKIYQCLFKSNQYDQALSMLESINTKKRTSKVNMALAKLYLHEGMDRSALTCYKEIIREQPLALEAICGLLKLGMSGADVMSAIMNSLPPGCSEWLNMWVKGHAHMANREFSLATQTFSALEPQYGLKDNVSVLTSLGETCTHEGHYNLALKHLNRVHTLDPFNLKHMDLYAFLLYKERKAEDLRSLSQTLITIGEHAMEAWVAMGYSTLTTTALIKNKTTGAIYCGQKAFLLDNRSVQALVLKATALVEMKKGPEAIQHFIEAINIAPNKFEPYQGLVDTYLSQKKYKEALSWATRTCETIGRNARSLTLIASVFMKDPNNTMKAKQYLTKAMAFDPYLLDPVYLMADIYIQDGTYEKACELLRKMLQQHSTTRLHQQLADCLRHMNQHREALDQYSISLSLLPSNARSREARDRIEKANELDSHYDPEAEDMLNPSDAEPDYSDMESTWSETELSQP